MRYQRDIYSFLRSLPLSLEGDGRLPTVRILMGPRQSGKTTLLDLLENYQLVSLDDLSLREQAKNNPGFFLDQFQGPVILDEVALVPELFFEIKKRVDEAKRLSLKNMPFKKFDYWLTGSNQTLLSKNIQESMAGRAQHYHLNTLSLHETQETTLERIIMRGGWPELYAFPGTNPVQYLNDLISSFIERDIAHAAGIEKKAAFFKTLKLLAGAIGEQINYSHLATHAGVESPTVQSWALVLEQNKLIKILPTYFTNLNKRLVKMPKLFFEDVGLAIRLQGWSSYGPIITSPYYGHIIENIAYSELSRSFTNLVIDAQIFYLRNKEKVEVDFLIELPNKKFIAAEVKTSPRDYTVEQLKLIDSLKIDVVEKWILTPSSEVVSFGDRKVVVFNQIYESLKRVISR